MSTTRQQYADRYECAREGCPERFAERAAVAGSYCSRRCADRDRGEAVLAHLERDHRFCSSCYRPHKVVYRPADSETPQLRSKALVIRESFVGFETLTEHAESAAYGIECECGAVGHRTVEGLCREGAPYEWYLALAVRQLRAEGEWDYQLDIATFADAIWEGAALPVAVGRALE